MSGENLDPGAQSALIWSNALALLRGNSTLTAREKGWFEGVLPEAVFGSTIILTVENGETQHVLQTELNAVLLHALELANEGTPLFPAFKILRRPAAPAADAHGSDPAPDEGTDVVETRPRRTTQERFARQTPQTAPARQTTAGRQDAVRQTTAQRAAEAPRSPMPAAARKADAAARPAVTSHFDDAVVQTFEDIMPGTGFDGTPAGAFPKGPFADDRRQPNLDPETHLNRNDTFDTFVPGDSNRFARTVALAVAEGSGRDFNPLCIYGGSGLGKTHLLNAIGNYALLKQPNTRVRYVTSEEFTNEFIESLLMDKSGKRQMTAFNRKYREVDVLLIDDIQFLGGKPETLEQFFHTFNSLYLANKRIVIASDVPPRNLKDFEDRLISRFEQGLTVDVQPPDLETRIAILRMMASRNDVKVPNDVLDLIAERFTENIRELEGALNRVTALASLNNQPVTRILAEQTLQDFFSTDIEVKPTDIIGRVAKYFHLTFDDLVGPGRTKNVTLARQIAMYLTRDLTSMSLVSIGQVFGGRDHTTVMHNCKIISEGMQENPQIYTYVTELTVQLRQRLSE